ncbi:hypothetical protein Bbelb_202080 [Branchiostoma belcheri]|nr:hypothetical protein Bbelb_202080 [Branchiostoma belcheri]
MHSSEFADGSASKSVKDQNGTSVESGLVLSLHWKFYSNMSRFSVICDCGGHRKLPWSSSQFALGGRPFSEVRSVQQFRESCALGTPSCRHTDELGHEHVGNPDAVKIRTRG